MAMRRRMSRRGSRKNFKRGLRKKRRNFATAARGGYRL